MDCFDEHCLFHWRNELSLSLIHSGHYRSFFPFWQPRPVLLLLLWSAQLPSSWTSTAGKCLSITSNTYSPILCVPVPRRSWRKLSTTLRWNFQIMKLGNKQWGIFLVFFNFRIIPLNFYLFTDLILHLFFSYSLTFYFMLFLFLHRMRQKLNWAVCSDRISRVFTMSCSCV